MGVHARVPEGAILEVLRGEKTQSVVAREWGVSRQAVSERVWKVEGMPERAERVKRVPVELPMERAECPGLSAEDTAIINSDCDCVVGDEECGDDLSGFCLEL
jgi:hypothetical protein